MNGNDQPKQLIDFRDAGELAEDNHDPGKLSREERKENAALEVARVITRTFAGSAALILLGGLGILATHEAGAKALLIDAGIPYLEKSGLFLSSTFGPLLAFVLGYYFGEKGQSKK